MSNVVVPQLGESVVEARVSRWLKKVGDTVDAGEPVVELETDKIDLEVGSDQPGVLAKIEREEGTDVKVGEVLAVVEAAGTGAEPQAPSPEPQAGAEPQAASPRPQAGDEPPAARREPLAGTEPQAPSRKPEAADEPQAASRAPQAEQESRITATARRIAEEHGVDLARVAGTGEGGRITKDDVQKAIASSASASSSSSPVGQGFSPTGESTGPSDKAPVGAAFRRPDQAIPPAVIQPSTPPSDMGQTERPQAARPQSEPARQTPAAPRDAGERQETRERMSKRRLTIARRLVEAQRTAAMLTTFNEVDMSAVMALRARRKESFKERYGVSLGLSSFFVKASIGALRAFPRLNAEIDGEEMVLKHYYDIGIAVGAAQGLVVPVLRDADRMSFAEIEHGVRDFAKRAEDGTLTLEDLKGGTFTITNGGVFGSLMSTPILNPPQVGILGLHKIEERPVAAGGQVVVKPMMYVALSYDHRIVDGAEAVQFLVKVKELIEDPGQMLIEG